MFICIPPIVLERGSHHLSCNFSQVTGFLCEDNTECFIE
jgi:hypothetical protein